VGTQAFKLYNNECSDDEAYFNKQVVPEDLWGMQEGDFDYQTDFADEDSEDQPNDADSKSDDQLNVSDDQANDDSDDEASTCIHARS
jgi:hypothetical protein